MPAASVSPLPSSAAPTADPTRATSSPSARPSPTPTPSATATPEPRPRLTQIVSGTQATFRAIQLLDAGTAIAVGANGQVVRLTADGEPAVATTLGGGALSMVAASFVSPTVGWVLAAEDELYRTTDSGRSWQALALPGEGGCACIDNRTLTFADESTGYVASRNSVYKTVDAGDTWAELPGAGGPISLVAVGGALIGAGFDGLFRIESGSGGWTQLSDDVRHQWSQLSFVSPSDGWKLDPTSLTSTGDGGATWQSVLNLGGETIVAAQLLDRDTGWLLLSEVLLRTRDGGETWEDMKLPTGFSPTALSMLDADTGWVAGRDGRVLRCALP